MFIFSSASHQTGFDTRSMTRRLIKVGINGGVGLEWTKAHTLLVCAAHRPTKCDVGLMSQAVSRTQIWVQARMPGYSLN